MSDRRPGRRLGFVAAGVALVLASFAVAFALDAYHAARARARADLRDVAAQVAADTSVFTTARLNALRALATRLPAAAGDPREVGERVLDRIASEQAGFPAGLLWLEGSGKLHASTPGRPADAGGADTFLREVLRSGLSRVSGAVDVPAFGGPTVVFAVSVREPDGRRTGVLAGGIPVAWLSRGATAYRLPDDAVLWITDVEARLMAGPDVTAPRDASSLPLVQGARSDRGRAGVRVGADGLGGAPDRVVAWSTDPRSGWTLFVEQPESTAFAQASRSLRRQLLGIGGVLLLGAALIGLLARRFDRLAVREYAARRTAERRLNQARSLGELAASLAGAVGVTDVRDVLLRWVLDAFGGPLAVLVERGEDGAVRVHRAARETTEIETERVTGADAADLLERRAPLWPHAKRELEPALRRLGLGHSEAIAVPLAFAGTTVAVVLANRAPGREFDDEDREYWRSFAAQAALALERARLNEREREIAAEFQSRLLPASLAGDDEAGTVAAVYRPAESQISVGGDWYDAIPLADGRLVLAVGDVIGHGVQAAVVMGQLRTAIMTLAPICDGPAELLERLDAFTDQVDGGEFSTVQCVYVDLSTGITRSASAGHPPMIVVDGEGHASYVWDGRSAPLCVEGEQRRQEDVRQLDEASTLLLFTDGLYERRGSTVDDRMQQLLEACEELGGAGPAELSDAVVDSMLADGGATDDVAVLALRLNERLAPARVITLPPQPAALSALRASVHEWLSRRVPDEARRQAIVLAVHEAVANAVEHGAGPSEEPLEPIVVELAARLDAVDVVVRDRGHWQEPHPFHVDWTDERGRGLSIIERIASSASVDRARGTVVRMRFDAAVPVVGRELEQAGSLRP